VGWCVALHPLGGAGHKKETCFSNPCWWCLHYLLSFSFLSFSFLFFSFFSTPSYNVKVVLLECEDLHQNWMQAQWRKMNPYLEKRITHDVCHLKPKKALSHNRGYTINIWLARKSPQTSWAIFIEVEMLCVKANKMFMRTVQQMCSSSWTVCQSLLSHILSSLGPSNPVVTSVVHLTLDGVNGKWRWRRNLCQIDGENSKLRRQSSEFSDGNAVIYGRYLRCHFEWRRMCTTLVVTHSLDQKRRNVVFHYHCGFLRLL
jgi:hypothetical protein